MQYRIGFGYDVHSLKDGDSLVLGGVNIPSHKSSVGHSDADVLIHAICDALLGAANLRDIGYQFPDTDNAYKGIDSKVLLERVITLLEEKGFRIGNIDCTVCLQLPKVNPYIQEIKTTLCPLLHTDEENLSIKATTTERLGFVGREEGLSAYAVALIYKRDMNQS